MSAAFNTLYIKTRINIKLIIEYFDIFPLASKDYILIFNTELIGLFEKSSQNII